MPFQIVHNDITNMGTDAIANEANTHLLMGGGVCGAIFNGAGPDKLDETFCGILGRSKTGKTEI